jgi:hypothetical protein
MNRGSEPVDADLEDARMRIYAIEDGAVRAQALAFALKSGLFEVLEKEPLTLTELSARLEIPMRVLPALVAFLASQDLLRLDDATGEFTNSPAASAFLVRSSDSYVGGRGLLFAGFYEAMGHLGESLASGQPWTDAGQHDMFGGFDGDDQRWFAEGMFSNAVHGCRALLRELDLSDVHRLLDVGGNAGGYSITLLQSLPHMEATIFDLPATRPLAEEQIQRAGVRGRMRFAAGSFFDDPLPTGHDAILLASILHDWDNADCGRILARCFEALAPGGLLIVTEPMLAEDATGPEHPSVSGLTMAVLGGENRTQSAISRMLEIAGFEHIRRLPMGHQNSTITARKPLFEPAARA